MLLIKLRSFTNDNKKSENFINETNVPFLLLKLMAPKIFFHSWNLPLTKQPAKFGT